MFMLWWSALAVVRGVAGRNGLSERHDLFESSPSGDPAARPEAGRSLPPSSTYPNGACACPAFEAPPRGAELGSGCVCSDGMAGVVVAGGCGCTRVEARAPSGSCACSAGEPLREDPLNEVLADSRSWGVMEERLPRSRRTHRVQAPRRAGPTAPDSSGPKHDLVTAASILLEASDLDLGRGQAAGHPHNVSGRKNASVQLRKEPTSTKPPQVESWATSGLRAAGHAVSGILGEVLAVVDEGNASSATEKATDQNVTAGNATAGAANETSGSDAKLAMTAQLIAEIRSGVNKASKDLKRRVEELYRRIRNRYHKLQDGAATLVQLLDLPHTGRVQGRSDPVPFFFPFLVGFLAAVLAYYFMYLTSSAIFMRQGVPQSSTMLAGGFGQGLDRTWAVLLGKSSAAVRVLNGLVITGLLACAVALSKGRRHTFFLYFSHWALVVQWAYLLIGTSCTFFFKNTSIGPVDLHEKVWVLQLNSAMMSLSYTTTTLATIFFWATDYPRVTTDFKTYFKQYPMEPITHSVMFLSTLLDALTLRQPFYIADMVFPISFVFAYVSFNCVYFKVGDGTDEVGNKFSYPLLAWDDHFFRALGVGMALAFLAAPALHMLFYAIAKCTEKPVKDPLMDLGPYGSSTSDRDSSAGLSELEDSTPTRSEAKRDPYNTERDRGSQSHPTLGRLQRPSATAEIDESLEEFSRKSREMTASRKQRAGD